MGGNKTGVCPVTGQTLACKYNSTERDFPWGLLRQKVDGTGPLDFTGYLAVHLGGQEVYKRQLLALFLISGRREAASWNRCTCSCR